MGYSEIIQELERNVLILQERIKELKSFDHSTAFDTLLTREEAAELMGKSTRQLDRDCDRYGIPKEHIGGGVRIRKYYILRHMGVLPPEPQGPQSEFDRIRNQYGA